MLLERRNVRLIIHQGTALVLTAELRTAGAFAAKIIGKLHAVYLLRFAEYRRTHVTRVGRWRHRLLLLTQLVAIATVSKRQPIRGAGSQSGSEHRHGSAQRHTEHKQHNHILLLLLLNQGKPPVVQTLKRRNTKCLVVYPTLAGRHQRNRHAAEWS